MAHNLSSGDLNTGLLLAVISQVTTMTECHWPISLCINPHQGFYILQAVVSSKAIYSSYNSGFVLSLSHYILRAAKSAMFQCFWFSRLGTFLYLCSICYYFWICCQSQIIIKFCIIICPDITGNFPEAVFIFTCVSIINIFVALYYCSLR